MPTTEHTIKLKADARDIKGAGATIKTAFSPLTIREFRRENEQLSRVMRELSAEQLRLSKNLLGVQKGTDEYKKLRKELDGINDTAKTVQTSLGGLQRSYKDLAQVRRQSFIGGAMAGAGVAQFLPAGPGGYPRMAGALLGGGVRRAAGAGAAPFMTPGMGGLSSLLGAIPGVGGAAQGALQAGQGMYQQAVAFSQAQLQNVRFLAGGARAGAAYMGAATPAGAQAAMAKAQRAAGDAQVQAAASQARIVGMAAAPVAGAFGKGDRGGTGLGIERKVASLGLAGLGGLAAEHFAKYRPKGLSDKIWNRAISETIKEGTGIDAGILKGALGAISPSAAAGLAAGGAQVKSEAANDRLQKAKSVASRALVMARRASFRQAAGEEVVALPGAGFGARFGMTGTQTQQALGEFMGASGGMFTRGARGGFEEALAVRTAFGVGAGQSGSYARMGMAGGGGVKNQMGLAAVLETAVEMGLKGSRTVELLSEIVSLGQQAEKTGVKFNAEHFMRTTGMLKVGGLAAPQAQRIAGGLGRKAMDLSARGVQTPADLAMLRAFGYDPAGGRLSYVRAIAAAEGGMTPDALGNLMGMVTENYKGPEEIQAFHLRRFLSRGLGTPIGTADATTLLRSKLGGATNEEMMVRVEGMMQRGQSAGNRQAIIAGSQGLARMGGGGIAIGAAALQSRAVGKGASLAGMFQRLEKIGQDNVTVLSNFKGGIEGVVRAMQDAVTAMDAITSGDILNNIQSIFGGGKSTAPKSGARR